MFRFLNVMRQKKNNIGSIFCIKRMIYTWTMKNNYQSVKNYSVNSANASVSDLDITKSPHN